MKTVMTIAGSDSGGGAGIQADLKTFAAHGVYGTSAITAVTAQNTTGVAQVFALPVEIVIAQMEAIAGDFELHATKVGMLATAAIVEAVAATIAELDLPLVVVDPVMIAKGGHRLVDEEAVAGMKAELLRRAYLVTPNALEAAALAGIRVDSIADAREAARHIGQLGPSAVLVKGGHLKGEAAVDILYDGHHFHELRAERIQSGNTHGTGCTLSSAIAANLACGVPLPDAVDRAKQYVTGGIREGITVGHGHGPLHHFWNGVSVLHR